MVSQRHHYARCGLVRWEACIRACTVVRSRKRVPKNDSEIRLLFSSLDVNSQVEAAKEAAKEAGEEEEGPLEVEGFLFKRLIERRPNARQALLSFRDHLLASSSDNEALKARCSPPFGLDYFLCRSPIATDSCCFLFFLQDWCIYVWKQRPHRASSALQRVGILVLPGQDKPCV